MSAATGTRVSGDAVPSVSVVVLSKDEPELDATLTTLQTQCDAIGGECIVVDASDGRLDWIRDKHPRVRWIAYRAPMFVRTTIPHQRNVGVRAAAAPIVAFCDAGGEPSATWLETLTAPIRTGTYDVTCGPVTSTRPGVYRTINDVPDGTVVDAVLTANLAFTIEAFDAVDGFDERFEYGSDADFAWRLIGAGRPPRSIQAAVMGMDWGAWGLQRKRSWRYGKARGRLLRFHPQRRVAILRTRPELVVYPALLAWALTGVVAAVIGALSIGGAILASTMLAVAVLRWRNRRHERPWAVLLSHCIYAVALLRELAGAAVRRMPPVLHAPHDPDPYQAHLIDALTADGVSNGFYEGPTGSKTLNVVLFPLHALLLRVRGVRILHLHWLHAYHLHWARATPLRRVLRWLFAVHLSALRLVGIRVVWTAHNVLPHTPIFDDDAAARRLLVRRATVIAHSEHAGHVVREQFGAGDVHCIAQGIVPIPVVDRDVARHTLGIDDASIVVSLVGRVERYKCFDAVLEGVATCSAPSKVHVVVAGQCGDADVRGTIEAAAGRARAAGARVDLSLRRQSELELATAIGAANLVAYPFSSITNSGSILLALQSGRAALVRDLPALAHLPDDTVYRCGAGADGVAAAIERAVHTDPGVLDETGARAQRLVADWTWERAAAATRSVYEQAIGSGR